jgi:hypothetical protein
MRCGTGCRRLDRRRVGIRDWCTPRGASVHEGMNTNEALSISRCNSCRYRRIFGSAFAQGCQAEMTIARCSHESSSRQRCCRIWAAIGPLAKTERIERTGRFLGSPSSTPDPRNTETVRNHSDFAAASSLIASRSARARVFSASKADSASILQASRTSAGRPSQTSLATFSSASAFATAST